MSPPDSTAPPAPPPSRRPWYLRPYGHVALSTLFTAASQPLLKLGAHAGGGEVLAFGVLRSGWTWLGIVAILISLWSWLYALRTVPLNIAFNLAGAVYFLVPLAAWLFLGETISPQRWLGILFVLAGVLVTARAAVQLESKL